MLGKIPGSEALKGVPIFPHLKEADPKEPKDPTASRVVQQTSTLMSLISAHESLNVAPKASRVWLGEGLGAIPKRVHERMLRWEFMDMADFRPRSATEPAISETDTEKLVVYQALRSLNLKGNQLTTLSPGFSASVATQQQCRRASPTALRDS